MFMVALQAAGLINTRSSCFPQSLLQPFDGLADRGIAADQFFRLAATVHHGRVVAAAEVTADLLQDSRRSAAGRGRRPRRGRRPTPGAAPGCASRSAAAKNAAPWPRRSRADSAAALPLRSARYCRAASTSNRAVCNSAGMANCSSEPANSGAVPTSPSASTRATGSGSGMSRRAANCRGWPGGPRPGRRQRDHQPGRQAALQRRQNARQLRRRGRGRHHHPAIFGHQGVQRVNQLLLCVQLARLARGQHAEVFDDQQGGAAVLRAKLVDGLGLDGVGQFAGEIDRRGADDPLPRGKGTGSFCRNGPAGASHKRCLSPFPAPKSVGFSATDSEIRPTGATSSLRCDSLATASPLALAFHAAARPRQGATCPSRSGRKTPAGCSRRSVVRRPSGRPLRPAGSRARPGNGTGREKGTGAFARSTRRAVPASGAGPLFPHERAGMREPRHPPRRVGGNVALFGGEIKRRNATGSSRIPFRLITAPGHPAVLNRRDFVEAAPALPGDHRLRLPPASPHRHDGEEMDGLSPPSVNDSASWRTKALIRSRSAGL